MLPNTLNLSAEKKLPVCGKKIRLRGITVKEQKLLITATESHESEKDLLNMMIDTVKSCMVGKSLLVIEKLCLVDLLVAFLCAIELGSGASLEKTYVCKNTITNEMGENVTCDNEFKITFDTSKFEVFGSLKLEPIKIDENTLVTIEYPSPLMLCEVQEKDISETDKIVLLLAQCIKSVCTSDGTVFNDFSLEECVEWISNLNFTQFQKLTTTFSEMPQIVISEEHICEKCGHKHELKFEGIEDFFTSGSLGIQ